MAVDTRVVLFYITMDRYNTTRRIEKNVVDKIILLLLFTSFTIEANSNTEDNNQKGSNKMFFSKKRRLNEELIDKLEKALDLKHDSDKESDHKLAYKLFEEVSKEDDPVSLYFLGHMLIHETGVKCDPEKGLNYMHKAAELEEDSALRFLGWYYRNGGFGNDGGDLWLIWKEFRIPADVPKSLQFFEKSAKLGNLDACYDLGHFYQINMRHKGYLKKAIKWFTKAVKENEPHSCIELGDLYFIGLGVKKNKAKALKLYKIALSANECPARDASAIAAANYRIETFSTTWQEELEEIYEGARESVDTKDPSEIEKIHHRTERNLSDEELINTIDREYIEELSD